MSASEARPDPAAPLLSVVTVSLDAAATIEDTLASVAQQRAGFDIEHVCVDGGSKDGTREIIDRWARGSNRIRRVYERDTGIFDAMNKGLRGARGDYVLFLNADDFLASPAALDAALSGLVPGAPGNPDLVLGDVAMGEPGRLGFWRHRCQPRALARWRGTGLFALHQGMFAKRRLLQEVGGFDARLRLAADVNQFYDLERRFEPSIRIVAKDIAFMRAGGAANADTGAMWLGSVEIFDHLRPTHGTLRAFAMVMVKTLQSLSEVRWGRTPDARWMDGGSVRA
jgi:glycosyltransferase involved in cell wall biosynthesis